MSVRSRSRRFKTWCWTLLVLGWGFPLAMVEGAGTPNLPSAGFDYVDHATNLPQHFILPGPGPTGAVVDRDNTPANNLITNAGAELGRVLFYDKRLSHNNSTACASCHHQEHGFSDPNQLSIGFDGDETARHSMGLSNATFYQNGRFFWDERAATLEEQVLQPIQDPVEMGMNLDDLRTKLSNTTYYGQLFTDAFGDAEITNERIAASMAQFVRSMVSYESKFDSAFDENGIPDFRATFTPSEGRGHGVFNRNCGNCHGTNAQIGNAPANNGLDAFVTDEGAGGGRFKVPSLRNIEDRAGFMHDGRFATIREVLEFYSTDIQTSPTLDPRLRTDGPGSPAVQFNFTEQQLIDLEAFLATLTDTNFLTNEMFADPFSAACDFDSNGSCNSIDLDLMLGLGPIVDPIVVDDSGNELFDLNGDGLVNLTDVDQWLSQAATDNGFESAFLPGDANLDGAVDVSDLNLWSANKFTDSTDWSDGDFNGDGFVDVSDLNLWNQNKFQSSDLAITPVPEPAGLGCLLLAVVGIFHQRRRRTN